MFIYFWETERDRAWVGEGQRDGDTESEAGSRLWAVSTEPNVGLKLTSHEIMTWAKVGLSTDWATQEPQFSKWYILKCRGLGILMISSLSVFSVIQFFSVMDCFWSNRTQSILKRKKDGNASWCSHSGKQYLHTQKIKNRTTLWPSNCTTRYLSKVTKMLIRRGTCTPMFTAVLLTIAKV